ncbi:O-antigen ligase family protein [Capnocytophaga canimorsus]|uniref:O-antigen ligase family protein n=1 Tax=Capnocytophaga canimorsus TaxID=28188 RepID=UPI00385DDB8C
MKKKVSIDNREKTIQLTKNSVLLQFISGLLLMAYGYVTVLTPNWMAFDSNAPKFFTFAILNLVVASVVFFSREFRAKTRVLLGFFGNKIGIAFSVLMLFALFSFTKAINIPEAILHFFKLFTAFMAAWMVSALVLYHPKSVIILAIAMTLLLLFDVLQTLGGVSKIVKGIGADYDIKASYSNKNILASAMFIKIPFAVWLFYFQKDWKRIFGGIAVVLGTLCIFFMNTRAFYLATIVTMVLLLIYGFLNYIFLKNKQTGVKALSHLGLVLLAFGVFSFVQHYMYPKERREATSFSTRMASIANKDGNNDLRLTAWKTSIEMIQKDPILGVGVGNWKVRYLEYENRYSPHYIYMYKNHNDFLEIPVESGIFAGLAFLAIFILSAYYFLIVTYKRKDNEQEKWFFLPLLGLFAYAFDAFFNFPQDRPEIQSLFAIYVGIAVAFGIIYFSKANSKIPKHRNLWVILLGIVVFVVNFGNVVVQKMYFDSSKIQRMVKEEQNKIRKTKSPSSYLIDNYPSIPNLTAVAEPVDVEKARYLMDEKKFEQARKILKNINYSPWDARKEYFLALSYFLPEEKNYDSIYKYAHQARGIKPNFFGSLNLETFALNNMGKEKESIELWQSFLKNVKNEPQAWNALAYLQEKNNLIHQAKATLDSAFVHLPKNESVISNRNKITTRVQMEQFAPILVKAQQFYLQKDYVKALDAYTSFLEKVPNHIDAYGFRAICFYYTQKYKEALTDMVKQEQLGGTLTPSMNNIRASCFYLLGDRKNAKKYYEKAWKAGSNEAKTNLDRLTF